MNNTDLIKQAEALFPQASVLFSTFEKNLKAGKYSPKDGSTQVWGKILAALAQVQDGSVPNPPPHVLLHWFSLAAKVNTPLTGNEAVHPNSAAWMQQTHDDPSTNSVWPNSTDWTTTLYSDPDGTAPKVTASLDVPFVDSNGNYQGSITFPWRTGVWQVSGGDGHAGVIGSDNIGFEFEAFDPNRMHAHSTETLDLGPNGLGVEKVNAIADLSPFLGLVTLEDVLSGSIEHALRCNVPNLCGKFVDPAIRSDGGTPSGLPAGARLRLKSSVNINAITDPFQKMVATAWRKYGMFVGDQGGGLAFYVQSTEDNVTKFPWPINGFDKSWVLNFEVLAF